MERNPEWREPEPRNIYSVKIKGEKVILAPDNCQIFTHTAQPWADHAFVFRESKDGQLGRRIWRDAQPGFDNFVGDLIAQGVSLRPANFAMQCDIDAYIEQYGSLPEIEEPERHELTPRQEHFVKYFVTMMDTEHLIDEDFMQDGELYI